MKVGQLWQDNDGKEKRLIIRIEGNSCFFVCENCHTVHGRGMDYMKQYFHLVKDVDEEEIL